jgi:CPA1 family monovalent cation:H+ antiporter
VAQIGVQHISPAEVTLLFLREAGGGIALGFLLGYIGFIALKTIDNYKIEVLFTLAIVMGGYLLAGKLHLSGPLAMVIAGIVTGNKIRGQVMSETTRDYLDKFWELIDELMNAILFLLIGFVMLIIPFDFTLLLLGCIAIIITLVARYISVALPVYVLRRRRTFENNAIPILTWGGLRGGLSVAMALSIPNSMHGQTIVGITYTVVLFSIIVQGLTIGKLAKKLS